MLPAPLRAWLIAGGAAALLGLAAPAAANGRFPAAGQLVVDPADPSHLVLRATYGILQSEDAGATWRWVCEQGVGYYGEEDPAMGITEDGTILAGIMAGLAVSHDRACTWGFVGGVLADEYVIDLTVEPKAPSRALAMTSSGSTTGVHVVLAETTDSGKTWQQAGVAVDTEFLSMTVEVAPSNPDRVYLSGRHGPMGIGSIQRSDDRGKTWTRFDLGTPPGQTPYIGAVDPADPDRVYARVDANPHDELHVSSDGGQTWSQVLTGEAEMLGFALSPDGSRLAVGGPTMGVMVASTADFVFEKTSSIGAKCLKWTGDKLFACADELTDGFTVGVSTDEGKTFASVYHLPDLAPLECATTTTAGASCPAEWPGVAATIGADSGSGGAAAGGAGSGATAPGTGGATPPAPGDSSGCALAAAGAAERGPAAAIALASLVAASALALWRRQRPRRRQRARGPRDR
jgi:hypothetical protein